jgi:acyl-homoserine lactone acylase PvdQ
MAWAGHQFPGEDIVLSLNYVSHSKDLYEWHDKLDALGTYRSVPASTVISDDSGNIGYQLLATAPIHKTHYPHVGAHIFNGTSSDYDWIGVHQFRDLPYGINSQKGFYAAANSRIVPEHSTLDIGASAMVSTR